MTIRSLAAAASIVATCLTSTAIPCVSGEAAREQTAPLAVAAVQGTAPNFTGISNWFNSAPLNIADLRGKVVLVDFWTYGCVNCVNTLPHVTALYAKYKDRDQYWPAQYIVDQSGKIVFQHDGEGQYEQMDRTIARLLNASS